MAAAISPIITFKAGICEVDQSSKPYKVRPEPRPGYIYLYKFPPEDDLIHFCWRPRSAPPDQPELDLLMPPTDGSFVPYEPQTTGASTSSSEQAPLVSRSPTNGRIFVLKFASSSQRHLFWLQSAPQGPRGAADPAFLSARDRKIGETVDRLLQGEDVDVNAELAAVARGGSSGGGGGGGRDRGDDDETMEDAPPSTGSDANPHGGAGGAGPDATGGDFREEGEESREGGADGARAPPSGTSNLASEAVRNLLASLAGSELGQQQRQQPIAGKLYPQLGDLLRTSVTVPVIESLGEAEIDNLISFLPPKLIILHAARHDLVPLEILEHTGKVSAGDSIVEESLELLGPELKRDLVVQVLRSPMFLQSLQTISRAISEGGLPSIAEALGIEVENGGRIRGGAAPLGGGDALEAFVNGVKKAVQKKD